MYTLLNSITEKAMDRKRSMCGRRLEGNFHLEDAGIKGRILNLLLRK